MPEDVQLLRSLRKPEWWGLQRVPSGPQAIRQVDNRRPQGHLEGQHQTQLFAEPLQSLITVGCDRCRYNMMLVTLVEAVAHQGKSDPLGANYIAIAAINEHAVLLSSSWQSPTLGMRPPTALLRQKPG